jgi:hypothetical protein
MAVNLKESFSVDENGISITDGNGIVRGYITFINGASPIGVEQSDVPTFVVGSTGNIYTNFGPGLNDWNAPPNVGGGGDTNLDGGFAASTYLVTQNVDGMGA